MVAGLIASGRLGYAVVGALIALSGTILVLMFNIYDRSRSASNDRMARATELLTGGSQPRSAGIAIMEGSCRMLKGSRFRHNAWREAAIGLLANQAVYLLERSAEGDRPDEIRNLQRIVGLLGKLVEGSGRGTSEDFRAVRESLTRSSCSTDDRRERWEASPATERARVGLLLSPREVNDLERRLRQ